MGIRTPLRALGIWALAACLAWGTAHAATPFEPTHGVQGQILVLNGSGTRYKAIFKVYDMALYLGARTNKVDDVLNMQGNKRLSFVALREMPGTDLGVAFLKGLSNNNSPEIVRKYTIETNRLIEVFSGKPKLTPGDSFAMEYVPGKGTTFFIAGVAQGAPVGDEGFFQAVLRIWLGHIPADFKLKDALLGQSAQQ
ncbi:chalcone isomerase family protein [Curvibacter sp. CHRR-16]|uniref:chalcone isomerase family protein n=1 Tax=Curvibacter sp. CHRR-16 TaxID=2835872 RepID=UPI001BD97EC0|nr:chalcone isomerase family protein [Curvibacter sp. CHRR-16]MBT0571225.1 chalcone isomerase family protein [Curvibacter sp. CHRR-16]